MNARGGGWRVRGRAATEAIERNQPVGYDYVHSPIDDHSRLAHSEVLDDEKGATCAAFLIWPRPTSPPTV